MVGVSEVPKKYHRKTKKKVNKGGVEVSGGGGEKENKWA